MPRRNLEESILSSSSYCKQPYSVARFLVLLLACYLQFGRLLPLILEINFCTVIAQSLISYYLGVVPNCNSPEAYHLNIFRCTRKAPGSNLKRRISSDVIGRSPGALRLKRGFWPNVKRLLFLGFLLVLYVI